LYCALVGLMLSGIVAADCPYTQVDPTSEYTKCELLKPVETFVGDAVTVKCTKFEKINNQWINSPVRSGAVHITGYAAGTLEVMEEMFLQMGGDGYTFRPMVAGSYAVQIGAYSTSFTVMKDPNAVESPTGAAIVPDIEEVVLEPIEPAAEPATETPAAITPTGGLQGVINVFVNSSDSEKTKQDAPTLMLFLVGLMIA